VREYIIKEGDSFFRIAQLHNCCWQDLVSLNPGLDPYQLKIGQKIKLPAKNSKVSGSSEWQRTGEHYHRCDDVLVEIEGVRFRVTRLGEPNIPHENHLILPRTEIKKVEYLGTGVIETSIMISNINIVNSPRFEGENISSRNLPEPDTSTNNNGFLDY